MGGRDSTTGFTSNKTYKLHISDGMWSELGDLNVARYSASCTMVVDRIYTLPGSSEGGSSLDSIEVYSPERSQWTELNVTLHTARSGHISVSHPNGWIITVGGSTSWYWLDPSVIEVLNPWTDSVVIADCTYGRQHFSHSVHQYDAERSIVFLFGGILDDVVYDDIRYLVMSKDDEIWSTTTDSTDSTDSLDSPTSDGMSSELGEFNVSSTTHIDDGYVSSLISTMEEDSRWEEDIFEPTMQPHHEAIIEGITVLTVVVAIALVLLCICIGLLIFMICQRRKGHRRGSRIFTPKSKSPRIVRVHSDDYGAEGAEYIDGHIPVMKNERRFCNSEGIEKSENAVAAAAETHHFNAHHGHEVEVHQLIAATPHRVISNEEKEDVSVEIETDDESSNESMYGMGMEEEEAECGMYTNGTTIPSYTKHQYAPVPHGSIGS